MNFQCVTPQDMGEFVREYERELSFVLCGRDESRMEVDRTVGHREGIEIRVGKDADSNRKSWRAEMSEQLSCQAIQIVFQGLIFIETPRFSDPLIENLGIQPYSSLVLFLGLEASIRGGVGWC